MTDLPVPPGTDAIFEITCGDVIMGRGNLAKLHCGNVTYRKLVDLNKVGCVQDPILMSSLCIYWHNNLLIVTYAIVMLSRHHRSYMQRHQNSTSSRYARRSLLRLAISGGAFSKPRQVGNPSTPETNGLGRRLRRHLGRES